MIILAVIVIHRSERTFMNKFLCLLILAISGCSHIKDMLHMENFVNGQPWYDTEGNLINAHGSGIMYHEGKYYLYGEVKKGKTTLVPDQNWECYRVPAGGVACYSSPDLSEWKFEGMVLTAEASDTSHDLHTSRVIERPKVVYNETTKKFVMWMHIDTKDYLSARAGVAVSDNPLGPFKYLGSMQPNGQESRDITLYKDDDNKSYLIYTSESNSTTHICLLTDDYLQPTKTYKRIFIDTPREAPAIVKHQGYYYLITSGITGWDPNEAMYAEADSIMGDWRIKGNPCTGADADKTFYSQGTFILPVPNTNNTYLFMADRWKKTDLEKSTYVWLPFRIQNRQISIPWTDSWKSQEQPSHD
jgi:hypothetical protein